MTAQRGRAHTAALFTLYWGKLNATSVPAAAVLEAQTLPCIHSRGLRH